jgi:hypothetical protein
LVGDGRSVVALDAHESSPDLVDELASSQGAEDVRRLDAKEFEKRVRAAEQAAEDTTGSGSDWPPGE